HGLDRVAAHEGHVARGGDRRRFRLLEAGGQAGEGRGGAGGGAFADQGVRLRRGGDGRRLRCDDRGLDREGCCVGDFQIADGVSSRGRRRLGQLKNVFFGGRDRSGLWFGRRGRFRLRRSGGLRRGVVFRNNPANRRQDFFHRGFLSGLVGHVGALNLGARSR